MEKGNYPWINETVTQNLETVYRSWHEIQRRVACGGYSQRVGKADTMS